MSGIQGTTVVLADKIIFDIRNAELRHRDLKQIEKLDPLELAILKDLVESEGHLVPYQKLFNHWRAKYVSDGVLTRVISSLRGKFRQFEGVSVSIKNRPKQGYVLEATIEPVKPKKKPINWRLLVTCFSVILAVVTVSLLIATKKESTVTSINNLEYTPLISSVGKKAMMAFNPSFSHISFNTHNTETNRDDITIAKLITGDSKTYSEEHGLYSPVWLNEHKLVFRAKSKDYCQIKVAELDESKNIINTTEIVGCNSQSYFGDIEVLDENTILYTDAISAFGPAHLFKLDLNSYISTMIPVSNLAVVGIYKVVVPQGSNLAALLVSEGVKSTTVRIIDLDNSGVDVASLKTNTLNMSVAWDGKTLVAKAENSNLNFYGLIDSEFELQKSVPIFDNYTGVVNVPNGVAFILGNNYVKQLYLHDVSSQLTEQLTQLTNSPMLSAIFASKDHIYFVSTDTGIDQVRRIDLSTGQNTQLSNFFEAKEIRGIQINPSQTVLAVSTANSTEIFSINQEGKGLDSIIKIDGAFTNVTDQEIFYANAAESSVALYRYDLFTNETNLVYEGATFGNRYNDDIIFTFEKRPGVWRLVNGRPELLFETEGNIRRLLVRDQEVHLLGVSGNYYIYDGQTLSQQDKAPHGYQLEDIYGEFYLLNKASLNRTKVVALQDKTDD